MKKLLILLLVLPVLLCGCTKKETNHYDDIGVFGEYDMWPVQRDGKWGFIDHAGKLIIPCQWDGVGMVLDGRASVQKDGKWGAINREGSLIVPCEWQCLFPEVDGGYTVMSFSGCEGALAADGTVLIPCGKYTSVGPVINGARKISVGELNGLCTATGEIITPCQWYETGYFCDGLAWVIGEARARGYINMQGELVIPCQYSNAEDFVNGSAVVRQMDGSYQLIDTNGRYLSETAWPDMETFSDNELLKVRRDGKFGFVNRRGEIVIPPQYDYAQEFGDGWALVQQGGEIFWIDGNGTRMLDRPEGYTSLPFSNGLAVVWNAEDLCGLMDKQGQLVLPCQWTTVRSSFFNLNEITTADMGDKLSFINKQGKVIGGEPREKDAFSYGIDGEYLFLLENGVLSIYSFDGTQVY